MLGKFHGETMEGIIAESRCHVCPVLISPSRNRGFLVDYLKSVRLSMKLDFHGLSLTFTCKLNRVAMPLPDTQ